MESIDRLSNTYNHDHDDEDAGVDATHIIDPPVDPVLDGQRFQPREGTEEEVPVGTRARQGPSRKEVRDLSSQPLVSRPVLDLLERQPRGAGFGDDVP